MDDCLTYFNNRRSELGEMKLEVGAGKGCCSGFDQFAVPRFIRDLVIDAA